MTVVKIKKQKVQKSAIKITLRFWYYKKCFEATQLDSNINFLEKKEISADSIKKYHNEFIKKQ